MPWGYMAHTGCVLGTGEAFESLRGEHLVWAFPVPTHIGRWSRNPRFTWTEQDVGLDGLLRVAAERTSGCTQSESSLQGKILGIGSLVLILSFLQQHSQSIFIRLIYLLDKYSLIIFVWTDNLLINTMFQAFSAVANRPSLSL